MKEVEVIKARNDLQTRTRGKTIELMRVGAYCRVSTDSAAAGKFQAFGVVFVVTN